MAALAWASTRWHRTRSTEATVLLVEATGPLVNKEFPPNSKAPGCPRVCAALSHPSRSLIISSCTPGSRFNAVAINVAVVVCHSHVGERLHGAPMLHAQ